MSFLNPLFLFGLAAASIPILIHLFTRRRPREVKFSSLEFLSEVNQSEIRRLKLKQWLLLLLRTLAVAALALAMARPALKGHAAGGGTAATSVVVLLDRSGSMGALGANGPLFAEAKRVVEDVMSTLGPEDEMLLVPYDRAPEPLTARPSGDLTRLRAALHGLAAGAAATDHGAALAAAARALGETHALNRELYWISDFQETGFAPATRVAPSGPWNLARVLLVPLAPRTRANAALTDATLAPTESGAALEVGGASFGFPSGDLAVETRALDDDSELGRGFLDLPARGEASALVPLAHVPESGGFARIPDDVLALDNRRTFASGRAGTLRIVLREDGDPSALRLALEAGAPASGLAVEAPDAAALPQRLAQADVLVLNDVERLGPTELQAVLDFWRGGGALFVTLGTHADPAFWNDALLREMRVGTLGALDRPAPGGAWRLLRATAGHAALAGFPARPGEALSTARFTQVRAFAPAAGARVLLSFDRAHPALIEAPHALVFATGLDPASSDFPMSGAFLPLLHQAVKVLGRGTAAGSLAPGDRWSAPAGTGAWRIVDGDGRDVAATLSSAAGAMRLVSAPLERPGLYRVVQGSVLHGTFAVNPEPREGDLAPRADAALVALFPSGRAQVVHAGEGLARRVREARYGRELWSLFLIAALLLLVAETVIARWGMTGRARAA